MTDTDGGHSADTGDAVYLYGVSRKLDPAALEGAAGVGGTPVRSLVAGDLTALVSTVRLDRYGEAALRANLEDLAFLEDTARAHHDVVDRAAHAAPTAPVRIATIYRDDDRVLQVLDRQRDQFAEVLDRVSGRTEWGVKAYAHAEAFTGPAEPQDEEPGAAGEGAGGAGTAYLRRRQNERRQRQDAGRRVTEQAQAIHAELADHAVATRQHPPQDPKLSGHPGTLVLNFAYLIDDEQVEGFAAVARAIGERLPGIEVELTGPWPPYSFIDTADTTRADA